VKREFREMDSCSFYSGVECFHVIKTVINAAIVQLRRLCAVFVIKNNVLCCAPLVPRLCILNVHKHGECGHTLIVSFHVVSRANVLLQFDNIYCIRLC